MVTPLRKCIGAAGGDSFEQSLEQAEAALTAMSGDADAHLGAALEQLRQLARQCLADGGGELADPLHETASDIGAVAGLFGRHEMSEVAKLLSNLVVETHGTPRWSPRAVAIFVDALGSLFRGGEGSPHELAATLQVFFSRVLAGAARL